MKSHNQARANAARRRQSETGESYAAALQAVRLDRLSQLGDLIEADGEPRSPSVNFHHRAVPEELTELVRYHSHRITKYLYFAVDEGHYRDDLAEWQSTTLYKLTDALEHLHLLIGTIASYLREEGASDYFLRRYLQVRDDRQVEAYFTPSVEEHLAGLTGREAPQDSVVWYDVGRHIASRSGWSNPERHDEFEVLLQALYANYPDDSQAFDHLSTAMRERVLDVLDHLRS
ncbi:hypothetical protein [Streptomyces nitrosporeus]|uniref:hypothetical protein n=1 Tax=Streptomyces nitrosporeus TaxID=28894 RepID=UPI00167DD6AE|nr:hypothetical protein [Streptomyces nitrosporeus]GGZ18252.1 hypothetical protein GCM10010327_56660 [Streptomyces nitrosporeus]